MLNDDEQTIMLRLCDGASVNQVIEQTTSLKDAGKEKVHALIGRLAASGFIRGIAGYTDSWQPNPRRFMRLHLTQRCNLSCIHCYADSSPMVPAAGELPTERWIQMVDDFAQAGGERVLLTGGEALVYPGVDAIMRRAKARRLHVTLFSNGLLVARHIETIRTCVDVVQISVDGPNLEVNDPIRGPHSFNRAKEAIDLLINTGVPVRVGMVVMQQNWDAMQAGFVKFAKQWEGRNIEFRLGYGLTHHGRGEDIEDYLDVADTRPVVEQLMAQIAGPQGPKIARSTKGCGYAEQIVVAPDGAVHPCHLLDGAITHIDDQSFNTLIGILEGNATDYDVDHTVGCAHCDIRNLCGGTCRIQNGKRTGNRRVTNCTAHDKAVRLRNLVKTFKIQ
ncbi:radical SAM/SPASM domain-containing protein [Mycetohabitans endofungorum]|uniref:radical SAM/SPASM domain-containing protein n=1 Tax=Mycetohabitans endofungorum TaxID=417203 RepID=UPI0030D101DE